MTPSKRFHPGDLVRFNYFASDWEWLEEAEKAPTDRLNVQRADRQVGEFLEVREDSGEELAVVKFLEDYNYLFEIDGRILHCPLASIEKAS